MKTFTSYWVYIALWTALPFVHSNSLEVAPVTEIENGAPLEHSHPAFGMPIPSNAVEAFIIYNNDTVEALPAPPQAEFIDNVETANLRRHRMLEAVVSDITKLENYFGQRMENNFYVIKNKYSKGEFIPAPWPGSYWPTFKDGINDRWAGNDIPSPAEKYAQAYNKDVTKFTDAISKSTGIWMLNRPTCTTSSECSGLGDGSVCAKRRGAVQGRCYPEWWGICHAWAPASIMEQEPVCSVKKNGVEFKVMDIKALLTQLYDGASVGTVFTGVRFNGPDYPEVKDSYGRYVDIARRDLSPGYFHIAVTNIMGKLKKSFIVDIKSSLEVWNQPVRKYEILQMYILGNTAAASQQFFGTPNYPFNANMKKLAYVKMKFSYVNEGYADGPYVSTGLVDGKTAFELYTYVLELDSNNNIIGGEWLGNSRSIHPDFLWFPTGQPKMDTVTSVGLSYRDVRELLDASVQCKPPDSKCSPLKKDVNYTGQNIGSAASPTADGCCKICKGYTGCKAFSWSNYHGGTCWLKKSKGFTIMRAGVISSTLNTNVPTSGLPNGQKCSDIEKDVDYVGNDIGNAASRKVDNCCTLCQQRSGCKAYSWSSYNGGTCWLKSSKKATLSVKGVMSGTVTVGKGTKQDTTQGQTQESSTQDVQVVGEVSPEDGDNQKQGKWQVENPGQGQGQGQGKSQGQEQDQGQGQEQGQGQSQGQDEGQGQGQEQGQSQSQGQDVGQGQGQEQGQSQSQGQEQGQSQSQGQGQEQGQSQGQDQDQGQSQGQDEGQGQDVGQSQGQGQGEDVGQSQGQGQG